MIHVVASRARERNFREYLDHWGRPLAHRMNLLSWEDVTELEKLPRGAWLLADLDALGPGGRALAGELHDAVNRAGLPVLNDPSRVRTRRDLLDALYRRGLNRFRAVPAGRDLDGLRYPVFVRGASDHLGPVGGLLGKPADVEAVVARAEAAGVAPDDLLVVEFEDTSDDRGRFWKFGTYVVDGRIVPQHVLCSDEWMIKHKRSSFTDEVVERELELVTANPHAGELREIFALAGVEYGRVDYGVGRDGRVQVWEINLCPIIGRGEPSHDRRVVRQMRRRYFHARFRAAWESLDREIPPGPPLPFRVGRDVRDEAREELRPRRGGAGLMELLRAKAFFGQRW